MTDAPSRQVLESGASRVSPPAVSDHGLAECSPPRVLVAVLMSASQGTADVPATLPGFEMRRLWAAKGSAAPTPRQVLAAVRQPPGVMLLLDAQLAARWGAAAVRTLQQSLSGALVLVWSGPQACWVDLVLRSGVRGAVHADTAPQQLCLALSTVASGGMWFPRDFMQRLVEVARSRWRAHDPVDQADADEISEPRSRSAAVTAAVPPEQPAKAAELTPRERAVFELMRSGLSNKAIALVLAISVNTVKKHLHAASSKTGMRRRQAIAQDLKALR